MENFYLSVTFLFGFFALINCTNIVKPRGIAFERSSLYIPDKDFSCFDGSFIIPFSFVNDDYCDCPDASDEPGTSACPNGTFHCTNAGHTALVIPSSRVNDGICDCCDGSDEWANVKKDTCENTCEELGRAAREEAERVQKIYTAGYEIRAQLIAKGKELRQEKQNRIAKLFEEQRDIELARNSTLRAKETADEIEKSALEKYKIMNDEKKRQENEREKIEQQNEAFEIFNEIDTNKNNKIEEEEVNTYSTFDQNKDGIVSQDEKDYFMENKKEISLEEFMSSSWSRLKQLIFAQSISVKETEDPTGEENDKQAEETEDQDENEDENEPGDDEVKYTESEVLDESQYDDETKLIVEEAKKARETFEEADRKFRDSQREITHLQESLNKDFGPEDEFAALDGECYELSDREYIYKLCLFDQITQRSKNGGSEVRLGVWNSWIGEPKYRTMLYDRGQHCWNGPQRSTHVRLNCGLEPALISATEPNRCEYAMDFVVPAVCINHSEKSSAPVTETDHDEL